MLTMHCCFNICILHDAAESRLELTFVLQMYGPDAMHTLSGEVKACFAMLGGSIYCGTTKAAQVIKDYEADKNERYIPSKVRQRTTPAVS